MWVDSTLGVGTTFTFSLPVSPPIGHVARPGHQIQEEWIWRERQSRASLADGQLQPRLIVCDETGELRAAFEHLLDEAELVEARDLEGIRQALRQGPVQSVLVNVAHGVDPRHQIEPVRRCASTTPVIACSVPRAWQRAEEYGAVGYLTKPVGRQVLHEVIQEAGTEIRRVLVVDDDPDACDLFSRMLYLCDSSLEVLTATSGQEALDILRGVQLDLVLLDIVMADMDGWEVVRQMRINPSLPAVPTVFLTAQDPADEPLRSEFLLATVDQGLPLEKLLRCSLELSASLLSP
jgi:CheY-like chemotaxis protein